MTGISLAAAIERFMEEEDDNLSQMHLENIADGNWTLREFEQELLLPAIMWKRAQLLKEYND